MTDPRKATVTVDIAGEQYSIRTEADPDYARECASLVDRTIAEVLRQGPLVEAHKSVILAALSLADQLLQVRRQGFEDARRRGELAAKLAADIESALAASDLASGR
ncbi:MAG: cell division protein ZapA [Longimicrobiales bacterium]